ncbi:protein NINJA homolog 1-like [Zingiber officinale]|uniref:Ninja-family protein n=1 Tax=Zingiber officinale TaxID=94328 RepID=A0A8J5HRC3_ZINOF|nr:protein NINJA homolog 1-like [Zingiber officinale]XP_042470080.1 protein NINJA homolog 1-like [Zingiber officinale]XP_042470081.1 protein NINJA homolog 1-like [Zingiber officinale]KAG6522092.1 hypothetical protein ZIOFF_019226 [Zingiber officinale]
MEDDNELELSLGLSFGGSSGKLKGRAITSDFKAEEGSTNQAIGRVVTVSDVPFKNFLQNNVGIPDQSGKQALSPPQENFWIDIGKSSEGYDISQASQLMFTKHKEPWSGNKRINEVEEENSCSKKPRSSEINFQNLENVVNHAEVTGKSSKDHPMKKSHLSVATGDGSTGENEGVAESEAEVSSSWLVSQSVNTSKRADLHKVTSKHALNDPTGIGFQGQKQQLFSGSTSSDFVKATFGASSPLQTHTAVNVDYSVPPKPTCVGTPTPTSSPSPCIMQPTLPSNGDPSISKGTDFDAEKLVFGYSAIQLPTLETSSSWAFGSQLQAVSSLGLGTSNSQLAEDDAKRSNVPLQIHPSKGNGKHIVETGTSFSSRAEEVMSTTTFRQKEIATSSIEGFFHEGSAIKPGVASNVRFGGSGSCPDLPWVSATGPAPKGKTISGVTYKYNKNEVKIVCACHGSHMSPDEFIQHASADTANPENNTSLTSFTSTP